MVLVLGRAGIVEQKEHRGGGRTCRLRAEAVAMCVRTRRRARAFSAVAPAKHVRLSFCILAVLVSRGARLKRFLLRSFGNHLFIMSARLASNTEQFVALPKLVRVTCTHGLLHETPRTSVADTTPGRVKMNRRWPIARFATLEAADSMDMAGLSMRGPPGVTMMLSMQPAANDTSFAAQKQQQRQREQQRQQHEAEATQDQQGAEFGWGS